jgi:hypothetical protein
MFYSKLNQHEVNSLYLLLNLLERLRAIGHLSAHTEEADSGDLFGTYADVYDFTNAGYSVIKDGYDSSKKRVNVIENIERVLGRKSQPFAGTD